MLEDKCEVIDWNKPKLGLNQMEIHYGDNGYIQK